MLRLRPPAASRAPGRCPKYNDINMVQVSQKLNSSAVERTSQSVATILRTKEKKQSRGHALRFAATQVLLLEHDRAPLQQLLRFFYALAALQWHAEDGGLSDRNVNVLTEHAQSILVGLGVAKERSKLGNLHGSLESCLAKIAAARGGHWAAAMHSNAAYTAAMRASSGRSGELSLSWALQALRQGDAVSALAALDQAQTDGLQDVNVDAAIALRLRTLRLARRFDEARAVAKGLGARAAENAELAWETAVLACTESGDFRPLSRGAHKGKPFYQPRLICLALLYNLSADRLIDRAIAPQLETIIRRRDLKWRFDSGLVDATRTMDTLDGMDGDPSAADGDFAKVLGRPEKLQDVEEELLVWACAARHLARAQEFRLATLALKRYRGLSWALTEGKQADTLGLMASLLDRNWMHPSDR